MKTGQVGQTGLVIWTSKNSVIQQNTNEQSWPIQTTGWEPYFPTKTGSWMPH